MNTNGSGNPIFNEWHMMTNVEIVMHHEGSRTPKVQSLVFFFNIWVLFVVLQVNVFNVGSSMELLG